MAALMGIIYLLSSCSLFDAKPEPECDPLGPRPNLRTIGMKEATTCLKPDGGLTVEAVGGRGPYHYTTDDQRFQDTGHFTGLYAGDYRIKVIDANGCLGFLSTKVGAAGNVFTASSIVTPDNKCFLDNGSITILARNGIRPYKFQFEKEEVRNDSVFSTLKAGFYRIIITDAEDCKTFVGVKGGHGFTGVSYTKDIVHIINSKMRNIGMS